MLIATAWKHSSLESGRAVLIPANYGGEGSSVLVNIYRTDEPDESTIYDTHNPTYNVMPNSAPQFGDYVFNDAEVAALTQAGILQVVHGAPAVFVPPGIATA